MANNFSFIPFDKGEIEKVVREILLTAKNRGAAVTETAWVLGRMERGVICPDGIRYIFKEGKRSVQMTLEKEGMKRIHISVYVSSRDIEAASGGSGGV